MSARPPPSSVAIPLLAVSVLLLPALLTACTGEDGGASGAGGAVAAGGDHVAARPAPAGDDLAAVRAVLDELMAADNAGDLSRVALCYADDAVLMPPDGPVVEGRDAILERYRDGFSRFGMEVVSVSEETVVADDLAFDRGVTRGWFHWADGRPPARLSDKYLMLLRRDDDGRWAISHLVWSRLPEEF